MDEKLEKLLQLAKADPVLKERLLASRDEKEPIFAFCDICREQGIELYPGELIAMGEEFCAAMIRSVNGGGVNAPFGQWDDMYDMFMTALTWGE